MAHICRIPFEKVEDAHKKAPLLEEQREFNTVKHTHTEISAVIPDIPHAAPCRADWILLGPWLDLIIRSQRLNRREVHSFQLSEMFINSLDFMRERAFRKDRLDVEDLEELTAKFPRLSNEGLTTADITNWHYFARLDTTSLKDSPKGRRKIDGMRDEILPLKSLEDIFLRLLTSDRAIGAMRNYLEETPEEGGAAINLYLFPFNPAMKPAHEYRVFCCPPEGRIAAVSQYEWHQRWIYADCTASEQQVFADAVLDGCRRLHGEIMGETAMTSDLRRKGFVFDVFFEPVAREVRLIELNDFGARTGCGSCLFHWIRDARVLYGKEEEIEVRVAV